MGKAARNERRKLFAGFLNNLAVAALVTGLLIPVLALFWDKQHARMKPSELWAIEGSGHVLLGMFTGVCIAIALRGWAGHILSGIED